MGVLVQSTLGPSIISFMFAHDTLEDLRAGKVETSPDSCFVCLGFDETGKLEDDAPKLPGQHQAECDTGQEEKSDDLFRLGHFADSFQVLEPCQNC